MSLINFFKNLISIKINFLPPKKSNLLIYDRPAVEAGFVDILFKNKNYTILDARYESVNIYILVLSLLRVKFNLKKLNKLYKKIFLEKVSPRIVYTITDNNPSFYELKNLYSKPFYISDQFGIAKVNNQTWPNDFSRKCAEINKKSKKKLSADLVFVFNNSEKKHMSKCIKAKIEALGNTKCNNFNLTTKEQKVKKKKITFINSGLYSETIDKEIKIFNTLKEYCKQKKVKLEMIGRKDKSFESFYREKFGGMNWKYIPSVRGDLSAYRALSSNSLIIFSHSSLGLEALAIGHKCVIVLHELAKRNMRWTHPDTGFFWSNNIELKSLSKIIDRVIDVKQSKWQKKTKKIISFYLEYDYKNKKKKELIKKLIKKN